MSDDKRRFAPEQPDDENPEYSASSLFLEMMRQAARQANHDVDPLNPDLADFIEVEEEDFDAPAVAESYTPPLDITLGETEFVVQEESSPQQEQEPAPIDDFYDVEPDNEHEHETEAPTEEEVFAAPDPGTVEAEAPEQPEEQPIEAANPLPIYPIPQETGDETPTNPERDARLEAQRVRRIKRRRERQRRRRVGIIGGFLRTLFIGVFAAALAATIFTWFTEQDYMTPSVVSGVQLARATSAAAAAPMTPTTNPVTPNWLKRIGVISGHRGPENDPGAVCEDGLTESEINFSVAQLIVSELRSQGYTVDLLDEFDPRLEGYQAAAIVSIHANDCRDYGELVSGYLVARAAARPPGGMDDRLAECIALHYGRSTQLERRYTLTLDMTDYHTFREIHPQTPAAILELGFLKDDRVLLTQQQGLLAQSIINGVLCFLNGDNPAAEMTALAPQATVTPTPEG